MTVSIIIFFWLPFIVHRLDNLIMEAINNLKEPGGSNKTTIGTYIEVSIFIVLHMN